MGSRPKVLHARIFAAAVGVSVTAIGLAVLVGWSAGIPLLMSLRPIWIPMAPLTATCLMLSGFAVVALALAPLWPGRRLELAARGAGVAVAVIGFIRLCEHSGLFALGLDFLAFSTVESPTLPRPAPVALATALGLTLLGIAIIVESLREYAASVQILLALVVAAGWLGLGPYFYGGAPLLPIAGMAAHTAVSLILLSMALLCARPDGGLVALTLSDTAGGTLTRWLLPPTLLLPVALDAMRAHGESIGWFGPEAGQSLFGLFTATAFGLSIWGISLRLHTAELSQRSADAERQRLHEIVESSDDAIYGVSLDGTVTAWNCGAARVFGYQREEIVGRAASLLDAGDDEVADGDLLRRVGAGEHIELRDTTRRRKDGTQFPAWVKVSPVVERQGQVVGVSVIARDLSEQKRIERESQVLRAQFEQAQKMESVGRLAGGIAHDFNNLLTVINGYTEFALLSVSEEDGRLRDDLEQVLGAGQRAAALTRQLLAFSRRQVLRPEVLNLNRVVQDLEKMLRRLIGEDIEIQLNLAGDLGNAVADPGQIEQVIMNLSVNARDAMPQGGKLTIETMNVDLDTNYAERHLNVAPGSYVMLAVTDSGVGMDSATMTRIFEPFFTTKEFGQGTGLGLATVYGIVQQSGGSVWVYSEQGRGSVFKIYLPRTGAETTQEKSGNALPSTANGEVVLVVEDDDRLRALTERILTRGGYRAHGVGSGSQAIAFLRENKGPLDVVITDVIMPGMSGRTLAQHAANIRPDVAFVYMSGYTDDTIVRHGVLDKSLNFISKPFNAATLLGAVNRGIAESITRKMNLVGR